MIARMLVGSSSSPRAFCSPRHLASSSMKSGLPSAVSATCPARVVESTAAEELGGELAARRVGERLERQGRVCRETAAPAGPLAEELGPRERQEQDRDVADTRGERLEQIEQARVGPVDVLVHEQCRRAHGERLDEDTCREEELLAVGDLAVFVEAQEDGEIRYVLLGCRRPRERGDRFDELASCLGGVVAVEDACGLLDLLAERAVRGRRAVRRRTAADDGRALCRHQLGELERDPRLADPGRAEDRDEVAPSLVDDAFPDAREHAELAVAPDHRHLRRRSLADGCGCPKSEPRLYRSLLSLRDDRLGWAVLDRAAGPDVRLLADEHRSDRRRGLKTGRGVDHVPGDEGLPALGAGVQGDDRLARVHGHAQLEPFVLGPVAHGERGANRAFRVVPVRHGGAEDAHDRVANELLDLSAVALELAADALVVRDEERADVLGVELL